MAAPASLLVPAEESATSSEGGTGTESATLGVNGSAPASPAGSRKTSPSPVSGAALAPPESPEEQAESPATSATTRRRRTPVDQRLRLMIIGVGRGGHR